MQRILEALDSHARRPHAPPALEGRECALGYGELARAVERTAARLRRDRVRVVALALPNTPAWVVADLAAAAAGCAVVPIPPFFTSAQARHALEASGAELLLTLHPEAAAPLLPPRPVWLERHPVAGEPVAWLHLDGRGGELPAGAAKVTFTSGTTGEPKGVVLAGRALGEVAVSLAAAAEGRAGDRHLCLSPLAVLLENVAGVYAPLLAGATVRLASPEESGLAGGASVDGHRLARCLAATGATSAILTPGPLQALTAAVAAEGLRLPALRFLAVGGAPVSRTLLARATALGLPVYEGYGLSECASVVALNTPAAARPGSAGRPLPHLALRCRPDGEVEVRGHGFLGYLGDPRPVPAWLPTGDLGRLDAEGFLTLTGRLKSCFITAFGRNIAPEWVERELVLQPPVRQAAVFGEGRPWNAAVLVAPPDTEREALAAAVERANRGLPDYARVYRWVVAEEPFTPENGLLTATGTVRREAVWRRYGPAVDRLYDDVAVA